LPRLPIRIEARELVPQRRRRWDQERSSGSQQTRCHKSERHARSIRDGIADQVRKALGGFSQQAMELLQGYDWPGNVRELQNEVQRLVIQVDTGGFVTPELLSPRVREVEGMIERVRPTKGTLKEMMDQLERWLLIEGLREHQNNKPKAAAALGITRRACTRSCARSA
jgi:transcriptional regulator with PAS, ATPase and Fis domain